MNPTRRLAIVEDRDGRWVPVKLVGGDLADTLLSMLDATPETSEPTYSKDAWLRARDAWDAGGFGPEWSDWRGLAAKAGIIFPPEGSAEDSWGADSPSQRAIVYRAITETPNALRWALSSKVRSWGEVVGRLLQVRDGMSADADRRERDWQATKERRGPTHHVASVMATIGDSLGVER